MVTHDNFACTLDGNPFCMNRASKLRQLPARELS